MKITDILEPLLEASEKENDEAHKQAREETGFWGKKGAGAIVLALDTGNLLVAHRGAKVEEPHTWGVWGGAIDEGEDPEGGAKREVQEEMGAIDIKEVVPLFVFKDTKSTFKYHNFLFVVDKEFKPKKLKKSGWENEGHKWVAFGDWPKPVHFGLKALMDDAASVKKIKDRIPDEA